MSAFIHKHGSKIMGVLSGFDRLLFRGVLCRLVYEKGMFGYLCGAGVCLKDFGEHAMQVTERVKQASLQHAQDMGREIRYLSSARDRKEEIARQVAQRDRITDGLICVLKCVELCRTWTVIKNAQTHRLELRRHDTKCLHFYRYLIHPTFGFMHVRLQTWFPFDIQVWINGREWLARQLDVTFRSRDQLKRLWSRLVRYGIITYGPQHVMWFLGKKINRDGSLPKRFNGEITSDVQARPHGTQLLQSSLHVPRRKSCSTDKK